MMIREASIRVRVQLGSRRPRAATARVLTTDESIAALSAYAVAHPRTWAALRPVFEPAFGARIGRGGTTPPGRARHRRHRSRCCRPSPGRIGRDRRAASRHVGGRLRHPPHRPVSPECRCVVPLGPVHAGAGCSASTTAVRSGGPHSPAPTGSLRGGRSPGVLSRMARSGATASKPHPAAPRWSRHGKRRPGLDASPAGLPARSSAASAATTTSWGLGWHVDSNKSKRSSKVRSHTADELDAVLATETRLQRGPECPVPRRG
jgi:hypothetical protein